MRRILQILPVTLACHLFAGGFWLQLGNPEASVEARKNNAVLIIKATGCHDPAAARLSADAIGMVDGKRQTIALKMIPLSEPGTFVLSQQWPTSGRWVIRVVGKNGALFTNTLISAGPEGVDRLHARSDMRPFSDADVEALLSN
jgi:hypothetical protein